MCKFCAWQNIPVIFVSCLYQYVVFCVCANNFYIQLVCLKLTAFYYNDLFKYFISCHCINYVFFDLLKLMSVRIFKLFFIQIKKNQQIWIWTEMTEQEYHFTFVLYLLNFFSFFYMRSSVFMQKLCEEVFYWYLWTIRISKCNFDFLLIC